MDLSIELILILFITGIAAGFIDSIAGGGGLLTIPVLLWSGLPPLTVLGTNKLQGTAGTLTSSLNFYRNGHIPVKSALPAVVMTFIGSAVGTLAVQQLDNQSLATLLPLLLMAFALYFLISPRITEKDAQQRITVSVFAFTAGFGIGFYDGFFGPGTGSFFVIAYVTLLGYGITRATAHTKLMNFFSNIASLVFFQLAGLVAWKVGLIMAAGQIIGSYTGSHLSMKHGVKLIKPMLVLVSVLISLKLLFERFS
jgi:uncharacterized membrane protein YfcA